jgi:hypothetical protein
MLRTLPPLLPATRTCLENELAACDFLAEFERVQWTYQSRRSSTLAK